MSLEIMTADGWKKLNTSAIPPADKPQPVTVQSARRHIMQSKYCGWFPSMAGEELSAQFVYEFGQTIAAQAADMVKRQSYRIN